MHNCPLGRGEEIARGDKEAPGRRNWKSHLLFGVISISLLEWGGLDGGSERDPHGGEGTSLGDVGEAGFG